MQDAPLCACGCGEPVSILYKGGKHWATWRQGHVARVRPPRYRGGLYTGRDGYVYVSRPAHPRANSNGYVKRSIIVAEADLGRPIGRDEDVHHKNRVVDDDRTENLEVMSKREHLEHHAKVTAAIVGDIRRRYLSTSKHALAAEYGIHPGHVTAIASGRFWGHISDPPPIPKDVMRGRVRLGRAIRDGLMPASA